MNLVIAFKDCRESYNRPLYTIDSVTVMNEGKDGVIEVVDKCGYSRTFKMSGVATISII